MSIVKEGWLEKCGPVWSPTWNKRWMVLYDSRVMEYFTSSGKSELKGTIELKRDDEVGICSDKGKTFKFGFQVQTKSRTYKLAASNEGDRNEWIICIQQVQSGERRKTRIKKAKSQKGADLVSPEVMKSLQSESASLDAPWDGPKLASSASEQIPSVSDSSAATLAVSSSEGASGGKTLGKHGRAFSHASGAGGWDLDDIKAGHSALDHIADGDAGGGGGSGGGVSIADSDRITAEIIGHISSFLQSTKEQSIFLIISKKWRFKWIESFDPHSFFRFYSYKPMPVKAMAKYEKRRSLKHPWIFAHDYHEVWVFGNTDFKYKEGDFTAAVEGPSGTGSGGGTTGTKSTTTTTETGTATEEEVDSASKKDRTESSTTDGGKTPALLTSVPVLNFVRRMFLDDFMLWSPTEAAVKEIIDFVTTVRKSINEVTLRAYVPNPAWISAMPQLGAVFSLTLVHSFHTDLFVKNVIILSKLRHFCMRRVDLIAAEASGSMGVKAGEDDAGDEEDGGSTKPVSAPASATMVARIFNCMTRLVALHLEESRWRHSIIVPPQVKFIRFVPSDFSVIDLSRLCDDDEALKHQLDYELNYACDIVLNHRNWPSVLNGAILHGHEALQGRRLRVWVLKKKKKWDKQVMNVNYCTEPPPLELFERNNCYIDCVKCDQMADCNGLWTGQGTGTMLKWFVNSQYREDGKPSSLVSGSLTASGKTAT